MSTTAFTGSPEVGYTYRDVMPVVVQRFAGTGVEQRAILQDISRREYTWPMRRQGTERKSIDTFFRTTNFEVTAFYIRDPVDDSRTGVSLGTSVSGQTQFTMPTSGEDSRYYPVSSATYTVYDDGTETVASVSCSADDRRFTLSAAPTTGSVMTVDCKVYRLVRLKEAFEWRMLAPDFFECEPSFVEVVE